MRKGRVGFHMAFSALCVGQWNYKPRECSTR